MGRCVKYKGSNAFVLSQSNSYVVIRIGYRFRLTVKRKELEQ